MVLLRLCLGVWREGRDNEGRRAEEKIEKSFQLSKDNVFEENDI
jgi:hypothetical protein